MQSKITGPFSKIKKKSGQRVNVTEEKDEFLSNEHNRSKILIEMMKKHFLIDGQTVHVSNADADTACDADTDC